MQTTSFYDSMNVCVLGKPSKGHQSQWLYATKLPIHLEPSIEVTYVYFALPQLFSQSSKKGLWQLTITALDSEAQVPIKPSFPRE